MTPLVEQNARERRSALMTWLCERPEHSGLTAEEIADVSGLYDHVGHYRVSRCFDDCSHWAKLDMLRREGRPARWVV